MTEPIYTVAAALLAYALGILSILWWDQRREIRGMRREVAEMLEREPDCDGTIEERAYEES